jgi:hypothetical protein
VQSKRADVRIINSETLSDNWYILKNTPSTCSAVMANGSGNSGKSMTVATARRFFSTTVRKNGDPDAPVPLPCLYQRP